MADTQNQEGSKSSKRGFASMDAEQQREIASKGGKAAHEKGTANKFDSESGREAGRKGGQARGNSNTSNLEPSQNELGGESDKF